MMILKYTAQTMRLACALGLAVVGLSTATADLRYEAKGTEFDLTGRLVGDQVGTRLAMDSEGGYLVWQDNATDASGLGISALRVDAGGNPVGAPVRINSLLEGNQERPQVGMLPGGGAVFAWEGGASGFHRVHYRVANAQGVFLADDVFATGPESGEQTEPSLAVLKNGNLVLAWTDYLADGSVKGVSARVIGSDGTAVTDAFRLNKFTLGNQHKSRLVALPNGGFAAVWVSDQQQDAKSLDVVARIFSANGQALGTEVVVNAPGISANPSVALSGGSLVVAWEQLNLKQKQHRWDIGARSFDLNLKPLSEPVLANTHLSGDQFAPQLRGGAEGAMLVWNSLGQDKSREAVMGRFISTTGRLIDGEVRVNTAQAHSQVQPALSVSGEGKFLVAWSTPRLGESGFDIVGQRYASDAAPALLPPIAEVFVNAVSDTELLVSWPAVNGMNVKQYEVYFDGLTTPKLFAGNHVVWPGSSPWQRVRLSKWRTCSGTDGARSFHRSASPRRGAATTIQMACRTTGSARHFGKDRRRLAKRRRGQRWRRGQQRAGICRRHRPVGCGGHVECRFGQAGEGHADRVERPARRAVSVAAYRRAGQWRLGERRRAGVGSRWPRRDHAGIGRST